MGAAHIGGALSQQWQSWLNLTIFTVQMKYLGLSAVYCIKAKGIEESIGDVKMQSPIINRLEKVESIITK